MDIESGGTNGYNYNTGGEYGSEIEVEEENFTFHVDKEQLKLSLYKCDDLKRVPEIPMAGNPFERFFDNICEACEDETRCVKVYTLGATDWNDKGIGFISTYIDSDYKFMTLTVISSSLLAILITKVNPTTIYRKEQDAMIVWNDPFTNEDLALSFNDVRGCEEIYRQIELFIAKCGPNILSSSASSSSPSSITAATAATATASQQQQQQPSLSALQSSSSPLSHSPQSQSGSSFDLFSGQNLTPSMMSSLTSSGSSATGGSYFNSLDTMSLDCYSGNSGDMNAFESPGNAGFGYQDSLAYIDRDGGDSDMVGGGGASDVRSMSIEGMGRTLGLPTPTADNIGEVEKIITDELGSLMHRSTLIDTIVEEDYIGKLVVALGKCEDSGSTESLYKLFNIFKTLTLLNNTKILGLLFSPRYIRAVIGAFRYDKEIEESERRDYRDELEKSRFKEVVPFNNPELVEKIKETYNIQFVKSVVLAKYVDDQTAATLNSLIYTSQLDVLTMIESDRSFQSRLFHAIEESRPGTQERMECVQLLKEILCLPKLCLRPEAQFFRDLKAKGLFDHLHLTISDPLLTTRLATVEVIEMTLRSDPSLLRAFIMSQQPGLLLAELVDRLFWDEDVGLMMNMCDIVTALLDISGFRDMRDQKSYVDFLYKNFLPLLYRGPDIMPPLSASRKCYVNEDSVVLNVFEIYGYIVTNHGPCASEFLISNNILEKALRYTERRETHLVLAAVRFLRTVIAANDPKLTAHITMTDKFAPLMKLFKKNYSRYNLINSAVLEVFDYITKMKMHQLVAYAVKSFGAQMKDVTYTSTFEKLNQCYQEYLEQLHTTSPHKRRLSMSNGTIDGDDYNEAYFDEDDDSTANTAANNNNNNNNSGGGGIGDFSLNASAPSGDFNLSGGGLNLNSERNDINPNLINANISNDFGVGGLGSLSNLAGLGGNAAGAAGAAGSNGSGRGSSGSIGSGSISSLFENSGDYGNGGTGGGIARSRSANSITIDLGTPPVIGGTAPYSNPSANPGLSPGLSGISGNLLGYGGSNMSPMLQGIRTPSVISAASAATGAAVPAAPVPNPAAPVSPAIGGIGGPGAAGPAGAGGVAAQQLGLMGMAGQQSPGFLPVGISQVSPRMGSNTPTFTPQIMSPGLTGLSLIGGPSPSLGAAPSFQMSPRPVMSPSLMQLSGSQIPPPSIQGVLGSGNLQNQGIHQSFSVFGQQPGSSLHSPQQQGQQQQQQQQGFGYDQFKMNGILQQPPQKQPKY